MTAQEVHNQLGLAIRAEALEEAGVPVAAGMAWSFEAFLQNKGQGAVD
jgi:hypothetical protein